MRVSKRLEKVSLEAVKCQSYTCRANKARESASRGFESVVSDSSQFVFMVVCLAMSICIHDILYLT